MKGADFSIKGIGKLHLFCQKWYIEGQGFEPRGGASLYKKLLRTPPGEHLKGYATKGKILVYVLSLSPPLPSPISFCIDLIGYA